MAEWGSLLRRVLLVGAGSFLLLGLGAAAEARTDGATLRLWRPTAPPRTSVGLGGYGFEPGAAVDLLFGSTRVGGAVADESGSFTAKIQVPKWAHPGRHRVTARAGGESAS